MATDWLQQSLNRFRFRVKYLDEFDRSTTMKVALVCLSVCGVLFLAGCCRPWEQPQPTRPVSVRGWNPNQTGTVRTIGEFVLEEGQSTQSETLGIQIVKISPLVSCLGPLAEPPRKEMTIRIYRPGDGRTLCETVESEGSGILHCGKDLKLPSKSVNGINTKERWVWISLTETAVDQ